MSKSVFDQKKKMYGSKRFMDLASLVGKLGLGCSLTEMETCDVSPFITILTFSLQAISS